MPTIVALLAIRNEELYLEQCLQHLFNQGIEVCLINHCSIDNSLQIAEKHLGKGVIRIEHLPFEGYLDLKKILSLKEKLINEIEADWFIHHDADEIREAPEPYKTLAEGIAAADKRGYNAINFDEFVFLPANNSEQFEGKDYVKDMLYYYFFQPGQLRRVNAWKNQHQNIDLKSKNGHQVEFKNRRIFSTNFILRHYIALSQKHALKKYAGRVHYMENFIKGSHGNRIPFDPQRLKFPTKELLKKISEHNVWDRSDPKKFHSFLGTTRQTSHYSVILKTKTQKNLQIPNKPPFPFIVGAPRSGTTLLRLMLDAHPQMSIPGETHFFPEIYSFEKKENWRNQLENFFTSHPRWNDFKTSRTCIKEAIHRLTKFNLPEGMRCFYKLYAKRFGKTRYGDKTPKHILYMTHIQEMLPEAHFIHLIRDGRAVAWSKSDLYFGAGKNMTAQAADWIWRIREAKQQAQYLNHYLEIRYEELIKKPENTLKEICDFIELPYNSAMLKYYENAKVRIDEIEDLKGRNGNLIATRSQRISSHTNAIKQINIQLKDKWKSEMSEQEIKEFNAVANDMLLQLGYDV